MSDRTKSAHTPKPVRSHVSPLAESRGLLDPSLEGLRPWSVLGTASPDETGERLASLADGRGMLAAQPGIWDDCVSLTEEDGGPMPAPLAYDATAVVLVGHFNPVIFQPAWFSAQHLLSSEATAAALAGQLVVTPEVTGFSAGWVEVQVTPERFQAVTQDPTSFLPLRDLVLGTFTVLEHTPVKNMGFNRICHFPSGGEGRWHKLGDVLAPKEPWRDFFSGHIGLRSIMLEGAPAQHAGIAQSPPNEAPAASLPIPEGPLRPRLRIKLEPSVRVEFGVFVEVNQHYASPDSELYPLRELLAALRDDWNVWLDRSLASVDHFYDFTRGLP